MTVAENKYELHVGEYDSKAEKWKPSDGTGPLLKFAEALKWEAQCCCIPEDYEDDDENDMWGVGGLVGCVKHNGIVVLDINNSCRELNEEPFNAASLAARIEWAIDEYESGSLAELPEVIKLTEG